jgi:phage shock protein C
MSSYEPYPSSAPGRPAPAQLAASKQLTRSRSDKKVAGVCGGFAAYTGLDPTLVRLVLVAATVLGVGSPIIVYLAGWLLMPEGD